MAATPRQEQPTGVVVHHPRYTLPRKVSQNLAPFLLAVVALPTVRRLIRGGIAFDLIDAHFWYPDGVAAAIVARTVGKPFICTACSSGITLYRCLSWPRRLLQKSLQRSSANIVVCTDLVEQMVEMGAKRARSLSICNGVDLARFSPLDPQAARRSLGLSAEGLVLLSVGHLIERKGDHLAIEVLQHQPNACLLVVGSGPLRGELEALVQRLGVAERVRFEGQPPNDRLQTDYSAADVLVLASSVEGWANVPLEAMACGTPVDVTRVNGTPEVVTQAVAGRMADVRDVTHLLAALRDLLAHYPDRSAVRRYAEAFSWEETTRLQCDLFQQVKDRSDRSGVH